MSYRDSRPTHSGPFTFLQSFLIAIRHADKIIKCIILKSKSPREKFDQVRTAAHTQQANFRNVTE